MVLEHIRTLQHDVYQLGSDRPLRALPEQGILVVWAFFLGIGRWNRLKTRTVL
jgi:hypothetical protein